MDSMWKKILKAFGPSSPKAKTVIQKSLFPRQKPRLRVSEKPSWHYPLGH